MAEGEREKVNAEGATYGGKARGVPRVLVAGTRLPEPSRSQPFTTADQPRHEGPPCPSGDPSAWSRAACYCPSGQPGCQAKPDPWLCAPASRRVCLWLEGGPWVSLDQSSTGVPGRRMRATVRFSEPGVVVSGM